MVSEQGRNGGYQLKPGSEDVSLYDVLRLFEYRSEENNDKYAEDDPFSRFMKKIYERQIADLKRFTIRDIYAGENAEKASSTAVKKKEHVSIT